jgi:hypothetical protein
MSMFLYPGRSDSYYNPLDFPMTHERSKALRDCKDGDHDWRTNRQGYTACRWCQVFQCLEPGCDKAGTIEDCCEDHAEGQS